MILVTGAGGTVGREVVKQLSAAGAGFRGAYHSPEKAERARKAGQDAVVIDFARPETMRPALREVDRLFLLSGNHPDQTRMEIAAVRAAKEAGVRRLVKLSVWGAQTEAFSFARIHRPVEREIEASGLVHTLLRPNGFMQNMTNFFAATIRSQGAFHLPAAQAAISHIDARDIAGVAARILTEGGWEGKALDLSGPEALTYHRIAETISAAAGRKVSYVALPDAEFRKAMVGSGAPEAYADALIDLYHYYIAGGAGRVTPAVREVTGRDPIPFDQFVRDHLRAFLKESA